MNSLNDLVQEYNIQLCKGHIQKAYKGIMTFMTRLNAYLQNRYPEYSASGLYFGYMDMTYFAFTPPALKDIKLKVALVYVHAENRFEVWLAASNRKIQKEYIEWLRVRKIGGYKLSQVQPGVDSIIESVIVDQPDFDQLEDLKLLIEKKTIEFIQNMSVLLEQ